MKKNILYALFACGSLLVGAEAYAQTEVSPADMQARELYYQALNKFDQKSYEDVVKLLNMAEAKLKESNARINYLRARAQYALGNDVETQKACKNYFASPLVKDEGYALMNTINEEVSIRLDSLNKIRYEKALAEREAAAAKEEAEKIAAKNRAEVMKQAAERRAKDIEAQKLLKEEELVKFKAVQAKNTKEAYQQFIYDNPSGFYVEQAKSEMKKKWPAPVRVLRKNKYGYVNKAGDLVVKAKYDYGSDFVEGMARVSKAGKYGFVNDMGKEIIPLIYQSASNFNYGYAVVKSADNEAFFVNTKGEKMNDIIYNDAKAFSEGLAAVENEFYKYGFIDVEGNEVIPCEFATVSWFKEGLVAVSKKMDNGKTLFGYIDKEGKSVTQFEYEAANDFQEGVACVKKNGKFGLIDKFGGPITECEYDYISSFNNEGYALAKKGGWDVYLDRNGESWAKANGKYIKVSY